MATVMMVPGEYTLTVKNLTVITVIALMRQVNALVIQVMMEEMMAALMVEKVVKRVLLMTALAMVTAVQNHGLVMVLLTAKIRLGAVT